MKTISNFITRQYLASVVASLAGFEFILVLLIRDRLVNFDPKIDVAGLTAIPLLIIAVFQLYRQSATRRANFITGYLSRFHTARPINQTFHYLVATYTDDKFGSIEKALTGKGIVGAAAAFAATESLQEGRGPGRRYYHPDYFQGSEEERRLDALLGYLDIIGYQYVHGLVRIEDIAGMLGYQLSVILSRQVISKYLEGTDLGWWKSRPQSSEGAMVPYLYLRRLLAGFKEYNVEYRRQLESAFQEAQARWEKLKDRPLGG